MPNQENKVVRVEVEYEDGSIAILTGEEAEDYIRQLDGCFAFVRAHGLKTKKPNWVFTNKYPAQFFVLYFYCLVRN